MNKYQYTVEGVDYNVEIEEVENDVAKVTVNGKTFEVKLKQPLKPTSTQAKQHVEVPKPQTRQEVHNEVKLQEPTVVMGKGEKVHAPLPGTITEVKVNIGDMVKEGDTVVILEAMKMQNNIEAESSGKVTSILVKQGDSVMEGAILVTIEG